MIACWMRRVLMVAVIFGVWVRMGGCASLSSTLLRKLPPTSDDSWTDMAGGFPQH